MRWLLFVALAACGSDGGSPPNFPESYRDTYQQVRGCRKSGDHDLNNIRIVTNPTAFIAYTMRNAPFPEGSIVVKEEYDFADTSCLGDLVQWTSMAKIDGQWHWQRVDLDRNVESENEQRCIGCHAQCGLPPDGFDGTCAVP